MSVKPAPVEKSSIVLNGNSFRIFLNGYRDSYGSSSGFGCVLDRVEREYCRWQGKGRIIRLPERHCFPFEFKMEGGVGCMEVRTRTLEDTFCFGCCNKRIFGNFKEEGETERFIDFLARTLIEDFDVVDTLIPPTLEMPKHRFKTSELAEAGVIPEIRGQRTLELV